ncbi:hypothetical protein RHGRI_029829 [Rhododendron griersonianum]|uniref:Uncharacterized protein n=1 Tax=Rhododendron griersonianum TaxID=479676 RepID=A0AAV6IP90_9ERIC|nr:hypothetical protein RHGRI_029829 [Rhododendron griersonianum]
MASLSPLTTASPRKLNPSRSSLSSPMGYHWHHRPTRRVTTGTTAVRGSQGSTRCSSSSPQKGFHLFSSTAKCGRSNIALTQVAGTAEVKGNHSSPSLSLCITPPKRNNKSTKSLLLLNDLTPLSPKVYLLITYCLKGLTSP